MACPGGVGARLPHPASWARQDLGGLVGGRSRPALPARRDWGAPPRPARRRGGGGFVRTARALVRDARRGRAPAAAANALERMAAGAGEGIGPGRCRARRAPSAGRGSLCLGASAAGARARLASLARTGIVAPRGLVAPAPRGDATTGARQFPAVTRRLDRGSGGIDPRGRGESRGDRPCQPGRRPRTSRHWGRGDPRRTVSSHAGRARGSSGLPSPLLAAAGKRFSTHRHAFAL